MDSNNSGCGCDGCSGCLLMFVVIIISSFFYITIDNFVAGIGKPKVPDVTGQSVTRAEEILEDAGYTNITYHADDAASSDLEELGYTKDIFADWIVTDQLPSAEDKAAKDEEIALTCKSSSVIEQEEDYIAQKEALEEKLSGASALTAVQHYGEDQYPYGFDLHMLGTETVAVDADTWHLTATCDVTNEYGIEAEMTCEALVTGTTEQPTVEDFTVY